MQKPTLCFLLLATSLLLLVADARATRLYEIDLLKQDPDYKVDPIWSSNSWIDEALRSMKKEPVRKGQFLFDIASVKALQGKLLEALEKMALIEDDNLKQSADFLEERAEIKSLLGFDQDAILDMNRIDRKYQNWKTSWHRSLILDRAGRNAEARLDLRRAVAEAERFRTGDNYLTTLLELAKRCKVTALEPDPQRREEALSMIESILHRTSAPQPDESLKLLGLNRESFEENDIGEKLYYPAFENSPIKYAVISSNAHQIRIFLDAATCIISPDIIRQRFDAGTEQELWPGSMGGCGNVALTLYPKKQAIASSSFVFDGAIKTALREVFISYKEKSASTKQ